MNEHQQIEQILHNLLIDARVDELKNLAVQPHTKHASHLEMCIPVRHRNSRIAVLTASKSKEKA